MYNRSFHLTKPLGTPLACAKAAPNDFAAEPNVRPSLPYFELFVPSIAEDALL